MIRNFLAARGLGFDSGCLHYAHRAVLAVLSGLLLAGAFNHSSLFALSWFAFVPLLLAIDKQSAPASYGWGLLAGLTFYSSAAPWIVDFLLLFKGFDSGRSFIVALVFWFYCAQLPALLASSFTLMRCELAEWELLLFPLLAVMFYSAFPMLFSVQLGESQAGFLAALQGTAITGVYGLDFVLGLSNVLLYRLLRQSQGSAIATLLGCLVLGMWFAYGLWSLGRWDSTMDRWSTKRIGIVQPHDAPLLGRSPVYPGFSRAYPPELAATDSLAAAGAELVIWPEGRYKRFFDEPRIGQAIGSEVKRLGVDLLLQDMELNADSGRYNSVALVNREGGLDLPYRKIQRVAFGEFLPLAGHFEPLDSFMKDYLGLFFRGIDAGEQRLIFDTGQMKILPLICYETLFPVFAAEGLPANPAGVVMVGVSSNAWFGASRQPAQHLNASILRAVENRLPLVHVLNNGPSVAVLPNGRVLFESPGGKAGAFLFDLPYSPDVGGSFFSRYPRCFLATVYLALAVLAAVALYRSRTKHLALVTP